MDITGAFLIEYNFSILKLFVEDPSKYYTLGMSLFVMVVTVVRIFLVHLARACSTNRSWMIESCAQCLGNATAVSRYREKFAGEDMTLFLS